MAHEVEEGAAAGETVDELTMRKVESLPSSPRKPSVLADLESSHRALLAVARAARRPGAEGQHFFDEYLIASGACGRVRLAKPITVKE
jgi:hypothetical protein